MYHITSLTVEFRFRDPEAEFRRDKAGSVVWQAQIKRRSKVIGNAVQDPAKRVGGEKPSSHGPPLTLDKGQGIMDNGHYSLLQVN